MKKIIGWLILSIITLAFTGFMIWVDTWLELLIYIAIILVILVIIFLISFAISLIRGDK